MPRLDQERQKELEPERMKYACQKLAELGIVYMADETKVCFRWKDSKVTLFPYSGWHTGKSIKDGRGINKLIAQLKK